MLFMFTLSLIGRLCKEIVYKFDSSYLDSDFWGKRGDNGFIECNSQYIMSFADPNWSLADPNWSLATRNIYLPPHYMIYMEFSFYRIDFWDSDLFQVAIDNQLIYSKSFTSSSGSQLCGDANNDQVILISLSTLHYGNIISIYLKATDQNTLSSLKWGLSHFLLSIEPCPQGCEYCESNSILQCKQWALQYWDKNYSGYYYYFFQSNLYQILLCSGHQCIYQQFLPQHIQVMIRFRIAIFENKIFSVAIDDSIVSTQNLNNILFPYSISEFQSTPISHTSRSISIVIHQISGTYDLYIKDFQILIFKDDYLPQPIIPGCSQVFMETCLDCESGWEFDQLNLKCIPICGDKVIVGDEECDDGNTFENDDCHSCNFSCFLNCNSCHFGICQSCSEGYYLDTDKNCKPICGDGILIPYLEQCDENQINYPDICSNCMIQCSEYCDYCNSLFCLECDDGFLLILDNCVPVCGDKIIINEFEDCDDGNAIPFDGCFNCQYQCNQDCNLCDKGICLDQCSYGQVMLNHQCQSICGNNITTGDEECDDGNQIQYDGCHQCFYSCPQFCLQCEAGVCLECLVNYKLSNNACSNFEMCGDGEIGDQEECDDGNQLANDGCYNCQVEVDWICNSVFPSECAFSKAPRMVISYLNQTFSTQYVEITFSQQIKLTNDIPLQLQISVLEISGELCNITIYSIQQITTQLSFAKYCISIEIKQLMEEDPILQIDLNSEVINSNGISVTNLIEQIGLKRPQYLTDVQKQTAQSVLNFNQNILIVLGVFSVISLLIGETSIFSEILNTLQYISYLKFINLNIPENLFIFFQISDMVSITPLMQFFGLDPQINQLIFKTEYITCKDKFQMYQIDADLITNLSCQFLQCIGLICLILCIKTFQALLLKDMFRAKFFHSMSSLTNQKSNITVFQLKQKLYRKIRTFFLASSVWALVGFRALLLVNSLDLIFKIFLFLSYMQLNTIRASIQVTLSILTIVNYLQIISISLTQKTLFGKKAILEQNQLQYETITLSRQILFLAFLVFIQEDQVVQTLLINLINLGYFIILLVNRKINFYTNFAQQLTEGSILLYTISAVLYFDDFKTYLNEENKISIGFAHIFIISFTIIVLVVKYVFIYGKALLQYISKKITQEQKQAPIHPFSN